MLRNLGRFGIGENLLGISKLRELPVFSAVGTMRAQLNSSGLSSKRAQFHCDQVLFLLDPFTEYYLPEVGLAAWQLLIAAGCQVRLIPIIGSGRTRLSKGFLRSAQERARKMVAAIDKLDPGQEMAVIGVEPSEIYTLRDEYPDFFPDQLNVRSIAQRAFMLDEYLLRRGRDGEPRLLRIDNYSGMKSSQNQTVFLHGHCYQKSQTPTADGYPVGLQASVEILEQVGYSVEVIDAGCCGMAGAFGYEAEHYSVSMDVGELSLFPRIRQTPENALISAAGFSCLSQIKDGTGRSPVHFISLLHDRIMDI
jgi:Fe-S oxidoreductase